MIIVSQDKEIIINFEKVNIVNINQLNKKQIGAWFNCNEEENNNVLLGEYATEERAKEVLQEILTTYSNFETLRHSDEREKNTLKEILQNKYEYFDLYEMPQK